MTSTQGHTGISIPRVGMLAIVRKRRAIISEVKPFDGTDGVVHLVRLQYKDEGSPDSEELIWELEPAPQLLQPNALPQANDNPMPFEDFDAFIRGARWTAIMPYIDPDEDGPLERLPISSPFHGALDVENYQLIPLLKALQMPRVNLMIADDVGLGKTIEAGLILKELILRRRINRVLIITPASLRVQWQDEMKDKFSLHFDIVDRDSTKKLRRSIGIDANPWRSCSRIITSYYYLKQPDVMEQFRSACQVPENSPHLPWDLIIVDEVHNLMPTPFGDDSDLCRMLQLLTPYFEHKLFLTATPHNGRTRCFTGLLELLDPVRFSRVDNLKPAERERIQQVVIRRLKREINEKTNPPMFCTRKPPHARTLTFSQNEVGLIGAFEEFRRNFRNLITKESKKNRIAGNFALEILNKRLLSGPMTFIDSWKRCKLGLAEQEEVAESEVLAIKKTLQEETSDDLEIQQLEATASTVIGSWLKPFAGKLSREIGQIDRAVERLHVDIENEITSQNPSYDSRVDDLMNLIEELLMDNGQWRDDERLIIFTEYKTTLDYLVRRLREKYKTPEDCILCLYGGMDEQLREDIKDAFNDPKSKVRILVATDTASEGLNLQSTARYLLHYDCPWNPSRLEQRNGRIDRHGQARDVQIFHFASDVDSDLKFLDYLIKKVDRIREDLGATGELFDRATHQSFIEGRDYEEVKTELDLGIDETLKDVASDAESKSHDKTVEDESLGVVLKALADEIDLDSTAKKDTLETALAIDAGRPQLSTMDELERCKILHPELTNWSDIIDETIRKKAGHNTLGPIPYLAFGSKPFMIDIGERTVFRPRSDTVMMHLGHPLMEQAFSSLTRKRFPGPNAVSRWTVRHGNVPQDADALILLHLEEFVVNELREVFHHWIRTLAIPVKKGELMKPLSHIPAKAFRDISPCHNQALVEKARDLLSEFEPDLGKLIKNLSKQLTSNLADLLKKDGETARNDEDKKYRSRQGEISELVKQTTLAKLEKELDKLKQQRKQGILFENQTYFDELDRSIEMKEEELKRRQHHYEEIQKQLTRERERIIKYLLPKRYALQGEAQVLPLAVEIRFPSPKGGAR